MAHLRVAWAEHQDEPRVRIGYPNNLADVVSEPDLLDALPRGMDLHCYYHDGPYLLSRLLAARDAGIARSVVLRPYKYSHPFVRTKIAGVHELTARLWIDRSPRALVRHPVFTALSPYLPAGMAGAMANLLTIIFDPRWYADPDHPNRWSKIEKAFNLVPRADANPACARRHMIRSCWVAPNAEPGADNLPADFFGRRHAALLDTGVSEEAAVRKVGKMLVRAVAAAWLDSGTGGDPLFDPTRMFDLVSVEAVAAKKD